MLNNRIRLNEINAALDAINVDMQSPFAPMYQLVAINMFMAVDFANTLPPEADYEGAVSLLSGFYDPCPDKVAEVRIKLLTAMRDYDLLDGDLAKSRVNGLIDGFALTESVA
jgi:hypothetical protein